MKIADICFPHDTPSGYLRMTITRRPTPGIASEEKSAKIIRSLIRKASDTEALIDLIVSCDELRGTSERAAVMQYERPALIWREIRGIIGDRCLKTESDAGAVRVGTETFSVMIRNGRGDGTTRVAVFNEEPVELSGLLHTAMLFQTSVEGDFDIYDYDCTGGNPIMHLSGRYAAYSYDGIVIMIKWN